MAGWYLDDTETLRRHRENFRRAIDELSKPEFDGIKTATRDLLRREFAAIEQELQSREQRAT